MTYYNYILLKYAIGTFRILLYNTDSFHTALFILNIFLINN